MQELTLLQTISVWALPVLLAITLHEAAHGWVADRLGDPTATQLGRVTANPLKHIDLIGTIAMPMLMLVFTPVLLGTLFVLGWAKPVPVVGNPALVHPRPMPSPSTMRLLSVRSSAI